jgi:hypothetical protein
MKGEIISQELKLLFKALQYVIGNKNTYEHLTNQSKIKWKKIAYLSDFHNFNPILFHYFEANTRQTPIANRLKEYTRELSIHNLFSSKEFVSVSNLLKNNNIDYLPYKGHLFLEKLYKSKQLRSIGDLDILVLTQKTSETLKILIDDGYNFCDLSTEIKFEKNALFDTLLKIPNTNEISLTKKINGKNHFIDFHWGFHYSFLPYKVNLELLFEHKSTVIINGHECVAPSDFSNFIMLIIHHGGRECWTNLKYIADLMAFMVNFEDKMDWKKIILELENMKLKRPALVGLFLLQEYFEYKIPKVLSVVFEKEKINKNLTLPIVDYWENCYDILTLKGRLKYERILWSIQDEGFSLPKYFYEMYKMYSYPNPIESKRLFTFPEKWYFFNAISKLITYIYKRGFGKIKR